MSLHAIPLIRGLQLGDAIKALESQLTSSIELIKGKDGNDKLQVKGFKNADLNVALLCLSVASCKCYNKPFPKLGRTYEGRYHKQVHSPSYCATLPW